MSALPAVEAIELVRVALPLVRPFRTSFGVQHERDALLVRVVTAAAEGWGECVTTAAPVYSSEYTDGAAAVLRDHLVPALRAEGPAVTWSDVPRLLARVRGHHMARAALEVAVADAELTAQGVSLSTRLGATRDRVPAGVSVGIPDGGIPELLEQIAGHVDEGYLRIKCKVTPGWDVAPIEAVRGHFGAQLPLQVDANAAYDPDDADHVRALDALDGLGLGLIEQPFAAGRIRDHAHHARRWRTPVCLDESVEDARQARDAIEMGACGVLNLKLGRVGGLHESLAIHELCRELGTPLWCGGMLETGIGRAANVALASLPAFTLPGDTSASARYFAEDLTEPFVLEAGHLVVPTGPGLGVTPRPEVLRRASRDRIAWPRRR
jgi:o-succinylbenzoate synthase